LKNETNSRSKVFFENFLGVTEFLKKSDKILKIGVNVNAAESAEFTIDSNFSKKLNLTDYSFFFVVLAL
jgi:hypothetical protein